MSENINKYSNKKLLHDHVSGQDVWIPTKVSVFVFMDQDSQGEFHMKRWRMLVVSLRGINQGFWFDLGYS